MNFKNVYEARPPVTVVSCMTDPLVREGEPSESELLVFRELQHAGGRQLEPRNHASKVCEGIDTEENMALGIFVISLRETN